MLGLRSSGARRAAVSCSSPLLAHWFTQHGHGSFPFECAALGAYDVSVLHIGGEWQWLVRRDGVDVAEGAARTFRAAREQAEAVALLREE